MNKQIKDGADMMAGDGGYSIGTKEKYDEFVKMRNQPNLRIKKLAEQAGIHPCNFDTDADLAKPLQEFVKLIVNECGEVAFCNFHVSGVELGKLMKEHFGIE